MNIKHGHLDHPQVIALLNQHLHEMSLHSPPESIHALDRSSLNKADIRFWSFWQKDVLVGCVALKTLNPKEAEIKSMRTSLESRRTGVAKKMMNFLLKEAKEKGLISLYLETGSMSAFLPARKLYESFGFEYIPPFADYKPDENSVFMKLTTQN